MKSNFRKTVEDYLISKHGKISEEWYQLIDMLEDNLIQYNDIKEEIKVTGLFNPETYKRNPLLSTLKDLQLLIYKQFQMLGISPLYQSKLKNLDNSEQDVLKTLLSINED